MCTRLGSALIFRLRQLPRSACSSVGGGQKVELKKGTELSQRYVVHDVLGTGAHASVWRALDKQLNRDVALKRLSRSSIDVDPRNLEAAIAEARKNAQLVHPNIVQVFDIIEIENEYLIVMEYVSGSSLWDL